MTGWEDDFSDIAEEYFPGSSRKITASSTKTPAKEETHTWDASPRKYAWNETIYEFFSVGHLAMALQKSAVTIRLWESQGYIPQTQRAPSEHPSKRQRIYSRAQIEGIVRIAAEEGILGEARPRLDRTRFKERVLDLFIELAHKPLNGAVPLEEAA